MSDARIDAQHFAGQDTQTTQRTHVARRLGFPYYWPPWPKNPAAPLATAPHVSLPTPPRPRPRCWRSRRAGWCTCCRGRRSSRAPSASTGCAATRRSTWSCGARDERDLPETFIDYVEQPREHTLSQISTVLDVHTRVSDLYSTPHDQVKEQLRLVVESVKERQESELINNADYGLLTNVAPSMQVQTRKGAADARRPGRAHRARVEGAGLLPRAPARDRRLRPRVHAARRAAADGDDVRQPVPDVARHPARAVRQAQDRRARRRRDRQDQHPAAARRREEAGRHRALPARACRASRRRACRCASWASAATRSRRT